MWESCPRDEAKDERTEGSEGQEGKEGKEAWSEGENAEPLSRRSNSQEEQSELNRMRENVKSVIEENEALRQGMHEILDCIHKQDGKWRPTIKHRIPNI